MSAVNIIQLNRDENTKMEEVIISSTSSSPPQLLPVVVSSRTILKQFPEFLIHLLPYIADRTVFNAIASSNKAIYQISKLIMPPWPIDYKLLHPDGSLRLGDASAPVFSPDGTQIACCVNRKFENGEVKLKIAVFDQRRGLLRFYVRTHQTTDEDNNEIDSGWFSGRSVNTDNWRVNPDNVYGSGAQKMHLTFCENYLISAGDNGVVKIWDYNEIAASGDFNYVKLVQEFSVFGGRVRQSISIVDILTCGRFVAVGYATGVGRSNFHIILKDIHNNEKAIESLELPGSGYHGLIALTKIIDSHPSILFHFGDIDNNSSVRIWRPYDGKLLDTILELGDVDIKWSTISHDCSMLVLATNVGALKRYQMDETITLYSFDKDMYIGTLTLKQSVIRKRTRFDCLLTSRRTEMIQFSPDDKFISYHDSENGLTLWDVTTGNNITDKLEIKHDEYERKNCNVHSCSPVGHQRLLLVDDSKYYIVSFSENKVSKNVVVNQAEKE